MVVVTCEKTDSNKRYIMIYSTSEEFKIDFYHDRSMDVVVEIWGVN